jgi:hypothetical protein
MSKDSKIAINHLEGEKISPFRSFSGIEDKRLYTGQDGGRS